MDPVLVLAKFWGLTISITAIAFLINKNMIKKSMELMNNECFLICCGFMSIVIGVLSLTFYSTWSKDWKGLITLLGYLSCFKGFMKIAYPDKLKEFATKYMTDDKINLMLFISLGIGIFLYSKV